MREAGPSGEVAIPPYSAGGSHPRNLQELPATVDQPAVELLQARLAELMEAGLTGLSLVSTFVKRRVAPLQQRPSLMHEYTGLEDPSRLNRLTWSVEDFIAQIGRLTGYVLEDKNVPGLAAYRSSKPAPTVSRLAMLVFFIHHFLSDFNLLLLADLLAFGVIASGSGGRTPASG